MALLILAVGQDPMVLGTRCSILQSAGYVVRSATSVAASIDIFQDTDFDLILLCHSVSVQDRDQLVRFIRSTGSRIPIYAVESAAIDFQAGLVDSPPSQPAAYYDSSGDSLIGAGLIPVSSRLLKKIRQLNIYPERQTT